MSLLVDTSFESLKNIANLRVTRGFKKVAGVGRPAANSADDIYRGIRAGNLANAGGEICVGLAYLVGDALKNNLLKMPANRKANIAFRLVEITEPPWRWLSAGRGGVGSLISQSSIYQLSSVIRFLSQTRQCCAVAMDWAI